MGYNVYITRKENWFDEDGPEISLEEWSRYVETDQEMRLDGFAEASTPDGEVLRIEQPGIAVWVGYSGHGAEGESNPANSQRLGKTAVVEVLEMKS